MTKKTIHLHFSPETVGAPIISRMAKEFDLDINILQARIEPDEHGRALIQLCGMRSDIQKAIKYLKELGIKIDTIAHEITKNEDNCTHCGACVAVCPSDALSRDGDYNIVFDKDKCVLCQGCILACPFDAMELTV